MPSNSYFTTDISNISITGCANSRMHASFDVIANQNLTDLTVSCDDENVDIRILRSWYQNGLGIGKNGNLSAGNYLNAELLLYDYSLVTTDESVPMSYLTDISGNTYSISESGSTLPADVQIADASTLQPVVLNSGLTETFYLTITNIPTYDLSADLTIVANSTTGTIPLSITVPAWELDEINIVPGVYYTQCLISGSDPPLTSRHHVSSGTMQAQLQHVYDVGIKYPSLYYESSQGDDPRNDALSIRSSIGFPADKLFSQANRADEGDESVLLTRIDQMKVNFSGYDELYLYGEEEVADLTSQQSGWDTCHEQGVKTWLAILSSTASQAAGNIDVALLQNGTAVPEQSYIDVIHSGGLSAGDYQCPHIGQDGVLYQIRHRYGFQSWSRDIDAIFPGFVDSRIEGVNPWLDWLNDGTYRPIVSAYPTNSGAVSTWNLEYFGDAITDHRYLEKLESSISGSADSDYKTSAEAWIVSTKASIDSVSSDSELETLRNECISHISALTDLNINSNQVVYF